MVEEIKRIKIDETDIFFENTEIGQGKLTISNTYGKNYSTYWGAMGDDTLEKFITRINADYFANRLIGSKPTLTISVDKTFTSLRKHIRTEFYLPWYKELEFQKDLRDKINKFKQRVETSEDFINGINYFVNSLDFYLIKDRFDRESYENDFKTLTEEPWHLIEEIENQEFIWLKNLHRKLVKTLK